MADPIVMTRLGFNHTGEQAIHPFLSCYPVYKLRQFCRSKDKNDGVSNIFDCLYHLRI